VARRYARDSFDSTHDLSQIDGDAQLMEVARQAALVRRAGAPRWAQHRLVGSALAHGEVVLGVAGNRNAARRCEHAELRLVQGWTERTGTPLPDGARVAVTLQCCRMCAAVLVSAADGRLDVLYAEPDPGRLAQHTALQQRGWERLMSPEQS
jgi:tRNA(Arg) A34 adenosine deaminase TadA